MRQYHDEFSSWEDVQGAFLLDRAEPAAVFARMWRANTVRFGKVIIRLGKDRFEVLDGGCMARDGEEFFDREAHRAEAAEIAKAKEDREPTKHPVYTSETWTRDELQKQFSKDAALMAWLGGV